MHFALPAQVTRAARRRPHFGLGDTAWAYTGAGIARWATGVGATARRSAPSRHRCYICMHGRRIILDREHINMSWSAVDAAISRQSTHRLGRVLRKVPQSSAASVCMVMVAHRRWP